MRYAHLTGDYGFTEKERSRLLKRLNKEADKAWDNYEVRRKRWDYLEAFVDGAQVWDRAGRRLVGWDIALMPSESNDADDEQFIFNMARRIHNSNTQRLTGYSIEAMATPATRENKDKVAARCSRMLTDTIIRESGEDKLKRDIAWYLDVRGTVFLKHWFDPSKGELVHPLRKNPVTGLTEPDKTRKVRQGAVIWEAWDPARILLPEGCERLEDADWLEEFAVLSVSEIYRRTGIKVEKENISPDQWRLSGPDSGSRTATISGYKDHAILRTRYYRPSPRYSRGAIFTYTQSDLIRSTELKRFYKDIPFSSAHAIYNPKSPFGETWIWDVIPNCIAINEFLTSLTNYSKMLPKLQMQANANANIKLEKISNSTGQVYLYQGEKGLEPLNFPALPDSIIQGFNVVYQSVLSLGAAHDISRQGQALSGNALATLQQIDDSVLRPTLTAVEAMFKSAAEFSMPVAAKYYDTPRIISRTGMKAWEVEEDFVGSMLEGGCYNIEISLMTGRPTNAVLAREESFKAYKEQVITRDEIRADLEYASRGDIYETIQKSNEVAERAVEGIADFPGNYFKTQAPNPETGATEEVWQCKTIFHHFDDHALLAKKITEYARENYDHIQEQAVKETLKRHLEYHEAKLAQAAQAQAMLAAGPMKPGGKKKAAGGAQDELPGLKDSFQAAEQQPDRDLIPEPSQTGLQNA